MNDLIRMLTVRAVFGVPLIETIIREESPDGIPYIIDILSNFILKHGIDVAGIFRVAGSTAEIKVLKEAFDAGLYNNQSFTLFHTIYR